MTRARQIAEELRFSLLPHVVSHRLGCCCASCEELQVVHFERAILAAQREERERCAAVCASHDDGEHQVCCASLETTIRSLPDAETKT